MRAFAEVFVLLGALALVWAVLAYRSQRRFLSTAARAKGVVQSVTTERGQRGTTYYFPVISFMAGNGVNVTRPSKSGRNAPYQIGQTISVVYDPVHPENFEIDAFWSRWLDVGAALFIAVVFFGIAAGLLAPTAPIPKG